MNAGAPPRPAETFGRDAELTLLRAQLADGLPRWITLSGAPGAGTTHLAAELFHDARGRRRWRDARNLEALPPFDAAELDLLVLDDLAPAAGYARSLDDALRDHPRLTIIVTAHGRIGGTRENVLPVAPLALPAPSSPDPRSPALALFVAFARATDLGFALSSPESLRAAAELVCALDGLPGAIALAAARVNALDIGTLRDRVARDPTVLAPRHTTQRSLRASFDAVCDALTPDVRDALARLSVCDGPFDLELAEALCGARAVDALQTLTDRSLLLVSRDARGALRHRTYVPFRPWALATLSPAARREAERALATCVLDATSDAPELGSHRRTVLDRAMPRDADARARTDGLRAVLRLARPSPTLTAPLRAALDALLASRTEFPPALRATALLARGRDARITGRAADLRLARKHLEGAARLAKSSAARSIYADAVLEQGLLHHQRREEAPTRTCYERALAIYRTLHDAAGEGRALGDLGALDHDMGRYEFARERYREALERIREGGGAWLEGAFLGNLGVLEQELGRDDEAERCLRAALALLEPLGERRLCAITRGNLGMLQHARGDVRSAGAHHRHAAETLASLGDLRSEALAWGRLAAALGAQGIIDEAHAAMTSAERARDLVGDDDVSDVLDLFACLTRLLLPPHDVARAQAALHAARHPRRGNPPLVDRYDDARQAVLLLDAAIARFPAHATEREGVHPELVVYDEARRFCLPGGVWHDMSRHGALRRILHALAERRAAGAPDGLDADALIAVAWPNERIMPEAAMNRLHVALSGLRKRGLRAWLLRRDDGYLLAPALRVRITDDDPTGDA